MSVTRFSEAIKVFAIERKLPFIKENSDRLERIFEDYDISENNDEKRNLVIKGIQGGDWESHNPRLYKQSMEKSTHQEMLSTFSVSELDKMKLFKLKGFDIGYALKKKDGKFSEIVAVFNNESDVKGVGKELIKTAIKNGGCYLDHYDGYLSKFYKSLGFVEYERYKFDPQYDKDGSFRKKYGEQDVIFRKHKNCS